VPKGNTAPGGTGGGTGSSPGSAVLGESLNQSGPSGAPSGAPSGPGTAVQAAGAAKGSGGAFAFTGADMRKLLESAAALLTAGSGVLFAAGRRRTKSSPAQGGSDGP